MAGNCCLESNESDDGGIKEEAVLHVCKMQEIVKRVNEVTNSNQVVRVGIEEAQLSRTTVFDPDLQGWAIAVMNCVTFLRTPGVEQIERGSFYQTCGPVPSGLFDTSFDFVRKHFLNARGFCPNKTSKQPAETPINLIQGSLNYRCCRKSVPLH
ncbi:MAG: hypothetical protein Q9205_004709 [Flavoplaca limonia]